MRAWNWRAMRAIVRKDLRQVLGNKMVWMPMVILPIFMQVILPLIIVLLPSMAGPEEFKSDTDIDLLFNRLPAQLRAPLEGLTAAQQWVIVGSNYLFAPMFLIVPIMVSSILGADSFAGEKERKTLEGLLYAPVSDLDLFVAKVLTAVIPAFVVCVASFILYGLVVNLGGYQTVGRIFFPSVTWWPLVFWLAPAASVAALGATVLISSKTTTFIQTQQLSGMLVLPIVFLMLAQISGLFFLGVGLLLIIGLFVWLLGLFLIWIGADTFSRGELIARL